jgi:chitin synthase
MSKIVTTLRQAAERPVLLLSAQSEAQPPRRSPADPRREPLRLRSSGRRSEFIPSSDARRRLLDLPESPQPKAGIGEPLGERFSTDRIGQGALATRAPSVESGFKNVVCMTLYNEPFEQLRDSLSALLASIDAQRFALPQSATRSCIVIIADGRNRADPEILRYFKEVGIIDTGSWFSALGETVHLSRHRIDEMMASLGVSGDFSGEVNFAICVKNENRGKLHSHALFFQWICPVLRPELCYQLDAGTVVEVGAVSELVRYMGDRPEVAAAASRILTPTPRGGASILSIWQYMDFVMQKAVTWPTEVASGYLSVIPGQFCVFRWSAVSARSPDGSGERPLDTYLRGLNAIAPLERVMFLAEDRVFGNEIVLAPDTSWRIGYCPAAKATTDECDTFGELLRQRRRWQNSALAVRLWLWGRLPAYLARSDKSPFDKARFSASMLWQGLLTASEVMSPAFLLLLLLAAAGGLIHPRNAAVIAAIGGAILVSGVLMWLTFTDRPSRWQSMLCQARDTTATLAVISLLALAYASNPFEQAALMTAPVILMAVVIAASMPGQRWPALRHLPVYLLTDRLISIVLYGYALANVHNVTWGTKGLTHDARDQATEKQRMRRLRTIIAGAIVTIDVALIALGLWRHGVWIKGESSVVELFTLLFLSVTALSAVAWTVFALRSLAALFPWRSPGTRVQARQVEFVRATQEA